MANLSERGQGHSPSRLGEKSNFLVFYEENFEGVRGEGKI